VSTASRRSSWWRSRRRASTVSPHSNHPNGGGGAPGLRVAKHFSMQLDSSPPPPSVHPAHTPTVPMCAGGQAQARRRCRRGPRPRARGRSTLRCSARRIFPRWTGPHSTPPSLISVSTYTRHVLEHEVVKPLTSFSSASSTCFSSPALSRCPCAPPRRADAGGLGRFGKCDGYVVVSHGGERFSTRTVKSNYDPEWDESFSFRVSDAKEEVVPLLEQPGRTSLPCPYKTYAHLSPARANRTHIRPSLL
jgi:hypothetical protein